MMASAAISNCEVCDFDSARCCRCPENFGQLSNPCDLAITNCAFVRIAVRFSRSSFMAYSATLLLQLSVRTGRFRVMAIPDWRTSAVIHRFAHSRMASSPVLASRTNSFASLRYCSTFGFCGRGRASCGLGNIRISFHCMPGVRTDQAERRFVPSESMCVGGHGPFRGLDAPLALARQYATPLLLVKC